MKKSLMGTLLVLSVAAGANGQTVRVPQHDTAKDVWGASFNPSRKITFRGKVTGVEKIRPAGADDSEITLLVRNSDGGGTAVVDIGPSWYVDHQVAKVKLGQHLQITGSKAMIDGRGIILASQIRIGHQGGAVLALRRPNGRAYWMGAEVASNVDVTAEPAPEKSKVVAGQIKQIVPYTNNGVPSTAAIISSPNGDTVVDLGPSWYYGMQNLNWQQGYGVNAVIGPQPFVVGGWNIYPTYTITSGPGIYTLRMPNGMPLYNWVE